MPTINTYLCEKNLLLREGLKSYLADTNFNVIAEFNHVNELEMTSLQEAPHLLIIGVDKLTASVPGENHHTSITAHLDKMRAAFQNLRIVIMMPQDHICAVVEMFGNHADSYIPTDISAEGLRNYLNLAMMGEKVIPASAICNSEHEDAKLIALRHRHLSEREVAIVKYLVQGKSNKLIARNLAITESTVKVHLKTILRKLGVNNRTQAAMWAVQHGFEQKDEDSHLIAKSA